MDTFTWAFALLVGIEGDLSLDPNDPGNYVDGKLVGTKYGVAAKYHPTLDIPNLTLDQAEAIHKSEYWTPAGCDLLTPRAALVTYDCALNQGVPTAVQLWQRTLKLPPDSVLGPQTRAAFGSISDEGIARFMALRAVRYANTANFATQGNGWMYRLFTMSLAALPPVAAPLPI